MHSTTLETRIATPESLECVTERRKRERERERKRASNNDVGSPVRRTTTIIHNLLDPIVAMGESNSIATTTTMFLNAVTTIRSKREYRALILLSPSCFTYDPTFQSSFTLGKMM